MTEFLRKAIEAEQRSALGTALSICDRALETKRIDEQLKELIAINAERLMLKIQRKALDFLQLPKALHTSGRTPDSYSEDYRASNALLPVISFATIRSRLGDAVEMVKTLQRQDTEVHSVNLYVSEEPYLLDPGIDPRSSALKELHDLGANIYLCPNIGPYRKQYPCVQQLMNCQAPAETPIITLDDDVLYPTNAISILLEHATLHDAVVAHRGRKMTLDGKKIGPYRSFTRPTATQSLMNLANGRNGILYRLRHFPKSTLDYVGPLVAPTADDLWAKICTLVRCIPTVIIEPNAMSDPTLDYQEVSPSRKTGLFHDYNARGTNDSALEGLTCYFTRRVGVPLVELVCDDA